MKLREKISAVDPTTGEEATGTVVFGEDYQQLLGPGPDEEHICFCNKHDMDGCSELVTAKTLIDSFKLECRLLCEKYLNEESSSVDCRD
ncbi:MAG: hypothetical protein OEL89_02845 [Candidatus Peregrinibacteria bacterium]|nr:hypothetical protein [Candidatus Peregrinibacteria bacterium]